MFTLHVRKTPTLKREPGKRRILRLAAWMAATALAGVPVVQAEVIVANFTEGNGSTFVDQYPGIPGDGWTFQWVAQTAFPSNVGFTGGTPTVVNTVPLNGGGNYLSVSAQRIEGAGLAGLDVVRSYDTYGDISLTTDHRIEMDYRFDGASGFEGDNISVFAAGTANPFPQADSAINTWSWLIRAYGTTTGTAAANTWAVYDGLQDDGAFDVDKFVDTALGLIAGDVYHFIIDVQPALRTWDVTIINTATSESFSTTGLGFNTSLFQTQRILHAAAEIGDGTAGDSLAFSLDSILISVPVPEPATGLLGLGGLLAILGVRRLRAHS